MFSKLVFLEKELHTRVKFSFKLAKNDCRAIETRILMKRMADRPELTKFEERMRSEPLQAQGACPVKTKTRTNVGTFETTSDPSPKHDILIVQG